MFAFLAAARFLHFAALTILFGLLAFPFYAYGPGETAPRFPRAIKWSAVLTLISAWLVLLLMSANMGGGLASIFDPNVLSAAVGDTDFGRVWMVRILLALAMAAMLIRPGPARDMKRLILCGLLLASIGLTGHSAMPGGVTGIIHRLADAAHLIAAGWWIGGLLALVLATPTLGPQGYRVLDRFSDVGYAAVAMIVLTGLFKSAILIATINASVATVYGWTLLLKLALFAGMGALALANRFWITPGLKRGGDPQVWLPRLQRQVTAEFALGLGVLAVVGALGAMSPPVSQ
jgi:putative copper resistance protein D